LRKALVRRALPFIAIAAGIVCLVAGIMRGEALVVLTRAIRICL